MEKLQHWLDLTRKYQNTSFWNDIFKTDVTDNQQREAINDYTAKFYQQQDVFPRCDIYVQENNLIIDSELPGLTRNDIKVILLQNELVIKGESSTLKPQLKYFLKERANRTFEKKLTIPLPVNKREIRTYFYNGVLTIILPLNVDIEDEEVPIAIFDK